MSTVVSDTLNHGDADADFFAAGWDQCHTNDADTRFPKRLQIKRDGTNGPRYLAATVGYQDKKPQWSGSPTDNPRVQLNKEDVFTEGMVTYHAHSFRLPSDAYMWPNSWNLFLQAHAPPYTGSPAWALTVNASSRRLQFDSYGTSNGDIWNGPVAVADRWYELTWEIKWSKNSSTGYFRNVRLDGELQTLANGQTELRFGTIQPDANQPAEYIVMNYRDGTSRPMPYGYCTVHIKPPGVFTTAAERDQWVTDQWGTPSGPPPTVSRVKPSTVDDDFTGATLNARWTQNSGQPSVDGAGSAVLPVGSEIKTDAVFDVTDQSWVWSDIQPATIAAATGAVLRRFRGAVVASEDNRSYLSLRWLHADPAEIGTLEVHVVVDGAADTAPLRHTLTAAPTAFKVRAVGGSQVVISTSTDGAAFTDVGTKEVLGLNFEAAATKVAAGCEFQSGTGTVSSSAKFGRLRGEAGVGGDVAIVQETSNEGSATVTLTYPSAPTAGNMLIAAFAFDKWIDPSKVTHPAGWTKLVEVNGASVSQLVYAKIADGTETAVTATETASGTSPRNGEGWAAEISGLAADVTPEALINPTYSDTAATSMTLGPSGVLSARSYALVFTAIDTVAGTWGITATDGFAEEHNASYSAGSGPGFAVFKKPDNAAGQTVGTTLTSSVSDQMHATLVAFERTSAGGTTPPSITNLTSTDDPAFDPENPVFTWTYAGDPPLLAYVSTLERVGEVMEVLADIGLAADPPAQSTAPATNLTPGSYRWRLTVQNAGGGPFTYTRTWDVASLPPADTIPPDTTITSGPEDGGTVATGTATFGFESSELGSTFEVRADAGSWTVVPGAEYTMGNLTNGSHTFAVRATDAAGNTDPTPALRTFVVALPAPVDTVKPDTTITAGPNSGSTISDPTPTFEFTVSEEATVQVRIDSGSYQTAASPWTAPALVDGPHVIAFRAIDKAGNVEDTPAIRTFTVQTETPVPVLENLTAPPLVSATGTARFTWTLTGATPTVYRTRLTVNGVPEAWANQALGSTEREYTGLRDGVYGFEVEASNGGTPASLSYEWAVQLPPFLPVENTTTLGELKARLRALGYGSDTDTEQTALFNMVYSEVLSVHEWRFLEMQQPANLLAGVGELTIPPANLRVSDVRLVDGGGTYATLQPVSAVWLRDVLAAEPKEGTPTYWTVYGDRIAVYPTPNRAYDVIVDGYWTPAPFATDDDASVIPDAHVNVLVWGVARALAYRHRDDALIVTAEREYGLALDKLARAWGPQRSNTVERSEFWG